MSAARPVAEASGLEWCRAGARGMGGANGWALMRRTLCRAYGRRAMAGLVAWAHGWSVRPGRMAEAQCRAVGARRRSGAEGRAVMPRRKRPGVVMVMPRRRYPERREYGDDVGSGVIAGPDGYAPGIDASRGDCDRTSHCRAAVVVGTAAEGGAEQCSAEQRGEALHGRTPCVWKEGRRELPAVLHLN